MTNLFARVIELQNAYDRPPRKKRWKDSEERPVTARDPKMGRVKRMLRRGK